MFQEGLVGRAMSQLLKKELSEEAMTELKIAFYTASQDYLFVGKKK